MLLRRRRKANPMKNRWFKGRSLAWPLLPMLALVTLLAAISCGSEVGTQGEEGPTADEQASADKSRVETEEPQEAATDLGHPSLGEEGAPVLMIEYADYQ